MYAPSSTYGYGPGNSQQAPFNPNGPPAQQSPHHHQQQQPPTGQPQQHMMFNPQQFPSGNAAPYGASQPGMGPAGQNAGGGMGMMQNNGMPQAAGQHVSQYQTPYSAASYGGNGPVAANNLPPNFQMNATGGGMPMMPQQIQHLQNMQRMQPPTSSTPTQPVPRASPFAHSNTPPDNGAKQSQFPPPPLPQNQTSSNNQQAHGTIITPQTPNFPPGAQSIGGSNMAAPLSPGSAAKEQERVTLLLEINRELLMEVMALQASQAEAKKEEASPKAASDGPDEDKTEKAKMKAAISNREYMECMRRLQANLAYLAAIADKSHKPGAQAPTHPAILTAPPLVPKPAAPNATSPAAEPKKEEGEDKKDALPIEDRGERIETLKTQYKSLQALFPDVDPKKEGSSQQQQTPVSKPPSNPHPQQQGGQVGQGGPLGPGGQPGQDANLNAQQKMQNDQFRQKMMQQAQAQAQARAQAQQAR